MAGGGVIKNELAQVLKLLAACKASMFKHHCGVTEVDKTTFIGQLSVLY
jgi:hypothetical protein